VVLLWRKSNDLDGDPVTYSLDFGLDSTFQTTVISLSGLTDTSYAIPGVLAGGKRFFWCVVAHDNRGGAANALPQSQAFNTQSIPVDVGGGGSQPALVFRVGTPTPNPTLGISRLQFSLPREERVRVVIYDLTGRLVRVVASGPYAAGQHVIVWDGLTSVGRKAGAGVYFLKFESPSGGKISKLALAR
jgi:hypothetical protein